MITRLDAQSSADSICEVIDRDGGVIVTDVVAPEVLAAARTQLAPYLAAGHPGVDDFGGRRTVRVGALVARSEACRTLVMHPLVNEACASYLSPHTDGYQLHFTQAVDIAPGEGHQLLHRDRGVWGPYLNRSIETQFSTIWAVDRFTRGNGATRFVPGSHRWDKDRVPTDAEIHHAEMSPGSVLLYNGSVLHGGGRNDSEGNRLGVLLHYTLAWLRQEENQYLSCPPEVAQHLDPELRALLGYTKGGYVLGFYSTPGAPGEGVEVASPEYLFGEPPRRSFTAHGAE